MVIYANKFISYDGATGNKTHGKKLPEFLSLKHLSIHAGRSSQATLLGEKEQTIESLYLSPALIKRLEAEEPKITCKEVPKQMKLAFA